MRRRDGTQKERVNSGELFTEERGGSRETAVGSPEFLVTQTLVQGEET